MSFYLGIYIDRVLIKIPMKILKRIDTTFFKQSGFSLMEMMVGGAILIGASLAAIKMFSDQKSAQKRIAMDRVLDSHIGMLKMSLATRPSCNETLGVSMTPLSAFPSTISSIRGAGGPVISIGEKINNENTHTLSAIRSFPPSNGDSGLARLELDYNIVAFNKITTRSIYVPIRVYTNAGINYFECSDDQLGVEKTLLQEGCEAIGVLGAYDSGSQDCTAPDLRFDSSGALLKCPAGQDLVGIRSTGEARCESVNSHFQPSSTTVAPATPNCNGKQVRLRVLPGNKVGVECI